MELSTIFVCIVAVCGNWVAGLWIHANLKLKANPKHWWVGWNKQTNRKNIRPNNPMLIWYFFVVFLVNYWLDFVDICQFKYSISSFHCVLDGFVGDFFYQDSIMNPQNYWCQTIKYYKHQKKKKCTTWVP